MRNRYLNHIGGSSVASASGGVFETRSPLTGEVWGSFVESSPADIDLAVTSASEAFRDIWSNLSATRRGRLLIAWAEKIGESVEAVAALESAQNGKLMTEMRAQVKAATDWLHYFAGMADKVEGSVIPTDRTSVLNYTLVEPLGVVGIIVPWNSPTFITIMIAAPALAAGNTIVIKPSEYTAASALELVRLAELAGIPPGVINVVTGGREAGAALVEHAGIAKISFTGSDAAGREIASRAGRRLIGCVLELGGKSPNIVFDDADIDQAEAGVFAGIFAAAGQTCIAGSRVYIQESIFDSFVSRLQYRAERIVVGDPADPATQMGPIATAAQLMKIERMVSDAVSEGASVLTGAARVVVPSFPHGLFYKPTILSGLHSSQRILQEEVFGPVLCVMPFKDDNEVVALANSTRFGLAAGIWTNDIRRAHTLARRIESGTVWINAYRAVGFNSPIGGYKDSGLGRMNGVKAIENFVQTKSVWCELSREVQDPFILKVV